MKTLRPLFLGAFVSFLALVGTAAVTTGPNNTGTNVINVTIVQGGGGSGSQTPLTNTVDAAQLPITNLSDIGFTPQDANFSSLIHVGATNGLGFRHSNEGNNIGNWYGGDATYGSAFSLQVMADDGAHDPRVTFVSGSDDINTMRWRPGILGAGGGRFSDGSDNYFLTYDGAGHVSLPSLTTLPQCFSITGSVDADLNVTASSMRSVKLQGGDSEDPDDAGGVIIKGGAATGAGTGGNITIQGGASSGGTQGIVNVLSVTHVLDAVDANSPVTLSQLNNTYRTAHQSVTLIGAGAITNTFSSELPSTNYAAYASAEGGVVALSYTVGAKTTTSVIYNILSAFTGNVGMSVFMDK